MAKLDKRKPYNEIRSMGKERYSQGGVLFDANGEECGKDPSFIAAEAEVAIEKVEAAAAAAPEPSAAESRLGDFGGSSGPMQTESDAAEAEDAAMRQAESAAD